jgi:hypothetical protein
MRSRHLLAALVLGLTVPAAVPAPLPDKADAARIKRLVEQLGSPEFQEREKAVKELAAIGEPALEALRKAAESNDAEVKTRAAGLVQKIGRQVESARALAPTRVHLVYKDTPLAEVVADLRKKTGYAIELYDPDGKLKGRKVTLDTGDTTFWRAFDQFCRKAGLVEATAQDMMKLAAPGPGPALPGAVPLRPLPAPPVPAPAGPGVARFKAVGALAAAEPDPPPKKAPPKPALAAPPKVEVIILPGAAGGWGPVPGGAAVKVSQIALIDGKAKTVPTDDATAVRVRSGGDTRTFTPASDGEILLALEATPEPKLQWLMTEGIKIEKAVDDQGQRLSQVAEAAPAPGAIPAPPRAAVFMPGVGWNHSGAQVVPVRLKKGTKAARTIKELKGVLTAVVLTADRPYITVEGVAKKAGQTVKGRRGGAIKILEVTKGDKDQVAVRFAFDPPPGVQPTMNNAAGWGAVGVPMPAKRVIPLPAPAAVPLPAPAAPPRPPALPPGALLVADKVPAPPAAETAPPPPLLPAPPAGRVGIAVGMPAFGMPGFAGYNGLTLQDEKGGFLPCQILPQARRAGPGAPAQMEYVLTYTAKKDVSARLVFSGRRTVTIEVPFTLKDVAIP